jgi:hypothetical protein
LTAQASKEHSQHLDGICHVYPKMTHQRNLVAIEEEPQEPNRMEVAGMPSAGESSVNSEQLTNLLEPTSALQSSVNGESVRLSEQRSVLQSSTSALTNV